MDAFFSLFLPFLLEMDNRWIVDRNIIGCAISFSYSGDVVIVCGRKITIINIVEEGRLRFRLKIATKGKFIGKLC